MQLPSRTSLTGGVAGAAIALAATTGVGIGGSWFDEQRILLLAVLVGLGLWNCVRLDTRTGTSVLSGPAIFAVAVLGAASAALSARPLVGGAECAVLLLLVLVASRGHCDDTVELARAAAAFAATVAACYSAGVVANLVSAVVVHMPIGRDTFLVGFSNPRFPAQLQALTLPLMPLALLVVRHRGARIGLGIAFALWWMCLVGSGSRTAWLALVVATSLMVVLGPSGRRWLTIQAPFAASGALLYVLIFHVIAPWAGAETALETGRLQDAASIAARVELAKLALGMVASSPLLGVGPMHFAYVDNGLGAHPHNFLLQIAAEWGLPVFLIVVALVVTLFLRTWRIARRDAADGDKGLLSASLLAALTAWAVGIQFDGYMVVPTSQVASMVVLMLCVALVRLEQPSGAATLASVSGLRRSLAWAPAVITVLALMTFLALPLTPFGKPTEREMQWRKENPGAAFWPRFWQQGWIGPDADPTAR